MKEDVLNVVLELFHFGWILHGFNTNTIVLIPKIKCVDTLDQFRPIVISNFKFKLISKTIVDILVALMSYLVTHEQQGFIMGDIFMTILVYLQNQLICWTLKFGVVIWL